MNDRPAYSAATTRFLPLLLDWYIAWSVRATSVACSSLGSRSATPAEKVISSFSLSGAASPARWPEVPLRCEGF